MSKSATKTIPMGEWVSDRERVQRIRNGLHSVQDNGNLVNPMEVAKLAKVFRVLDALFTNRVRCDEQRTFLSTHQNTLFASSVLDEPSKLFLISLFDKYPTDTEFQIDEYVTAEEIAKRWAVFMKDKDKYLKEN